MSYQDPGNRQTPGSQTEGREKGATALLKFRQAPFPQGPEYIMPYAIGASGPIRGSLICQFLTPVSPGGEVRAHIWVAGPEFDLSLFITGRDFRLMAGDVVIADGMTIGPPPRPPSEGIFHTAKP